MFARLTMLSVRPATLTQMIQKVREEVLPESRKHPGFLRGELLTRSRINQAVLLTYWTTEHDALEADKKGLLDAEMERLEPFAAGPAIVEGYEVSIDQSRIVR